MSNQGINLPAIDFSEVADGFVIPIGYYPVIVSQAQIVASASGDGFNVKWQFAVTQGAQEGSRLIMYNSLKQTALWRMKGTLKALGWEETIFKPITDVDGNILEPELVGRVGVVKVVMQEYQGSDRNTIAEIYHIDRWDELEGQEIGTAPGAVGKTSAATLARPATKAGTLKKALR